MHRRNLDLVGLSFHLPGHPSCFCLLSKNSGAPHDSLSLSCLRCIVRESETQKKSHTHTHVLKTLVEMHRLRMFFKPLKTNFHNSMTSKLYCMYLDEIQIQTDSSQKTHNIYYLSRCLFQTSPKEWLSYVVLHNSWLLTHDPYARNLKTAGLGAGW